MSSDDHQPPAADAPHPWADLAAAYALGIDAPDERAAFAAHLVTCDRCQAAVRDATTVAAGLAAAVATTPPPGLRARILAAARDEAGAGTTAAESSTVRPSLGIVAGASPGSSPSASDAARRRAPAPRTLAPWLAAAAALVLAAFLGVRWREERDQRRADDRTAAATIQRWQAAVAMQDSAAAARDSLITALLAPRLQAARLAPAHPVPDRRVAREPDVRLYWEPASGVVVVSAAAMPAAPPGRTYQLWGIRSGASPQSLGTFAMPTRGTAIVVLHVPLDADMDVAAVTEEPAGGSPTPTGAPLVTGTLHPGLVPPFLTTRGTPG